MWTPIRPTIEMRKQKQHCIEITYYIGSADKNTAFIYYTEERCRLFAMIPKQKSYYINVHCITITVY